MFFRFIMTQLTLGAMAGAVYILIKLNRVIKPMTEDLNASSTDGYSYHGFSYSTVSSKFNRDTANLRGSVKSNSTNYSGVHSSSSTESPLRSYVAGFFSSEWAVWSTRWNVLQGTFHCKTESS